MLLGEPNSRALASPAAIIRRASSSDTVCCSSILASFFSRLSNRAPALWFPGIPPPRSAEKILLRNPAAVLAVAKIAGRARAKRAREGRRCDHDLGPPCGYSLLRSGAITRLAAPWLESRPNADRVFCGICG